MSTTKTKRKIVNVSPVSDVAKNRFDYVMDKLHGCYVKNEDDTKMYLSSINKRYTFVMNKVNDPNWKIVK